MTFLVVGNIFAPVAKGKLKQTISQEDFDRKIKVWTILSSIVVALLGSATTIAVTVLSSGPKTEAKTEYKMSALDQAEVNSVVARMEPLIKQHYESNDEAVRKRLDVDLQNLAAAEASIMRKYNPNYHERWPPVAYSQSPRPLKLILIISIFVILIISIPLGLIVGRRIVKSRYLVQEAQ